MRPHGARELAHPEKDFYIVGMKSYGRAPTFLLATGYEQARSVVAMLAGDVGRRRARRARVAGDRCLQHDLCSPALAGCCGGPAPEEADACCVDDAVAKAEGKTVAAAARREPVSRVMCEIGGRSRSGGELPIDLTEDHSSDVAHARSVSTRPSGPCPQRAVWAIGFSQLRQLGRAVFRVQRPAGAAAGRLRRRRAG